MRRIKTLLKAMLVGSAVAFCVAPWIQLFTAEDLDTTSTSFPYGSEDPAVIDVLIDMTPDTISSAREFVDQELSGTHVGSTGDPYVDALAALPEKARQSVALEVMSSSDPLIAIANAVAVLAAQRATLDPASVDPAAFPLSAADAKAWDTLSLAHRVAKAQEQQARVNIELETKMTRGNTYDVTMIMQARGNDGDTPELERMSEAVAAPTQVDETVGIGGEANADILAADFAVSPLRTGWQAIVADAPAIWAWRITPARTGTSTIFFNLNQRVQIGSREFVIPVRNYPRSVDVEISASQWLLEIARQVQGSFMAIAAGIGLVCATALGLIKVGQEYRDWRRRRLRKKARERKLAVATVDKSESA